MATLREFQIALQEKLEQLRQRDEIIFELESELAEKDSTIERLQIELGRYRCLLSSGNSPGMASSNGSYRLQPFTGSPTSGTTSPTSHYVAGSVPHRFRFPPAIHVASPPIIRTADTSEHSSSSGDGALMASNSSSKKSAKEVGKRVKSISVVDPHYNRPQSIYQQQVVSRTKSCK